MGRGRGTGALRKAVAASVAVSWPPGTHVWGGMGEKRLGGNRRILRSRVLGEATRERAQRHRQGAVAQYAGGAATLCRGLTEIFRAPSRKRIAIARWL